MHQTEKVMGVVTQGGGRISDVGLSPMHHTAKLNTLAGASAGASNDGRRTILALVSASIISLVVWGLVVVLNVH
jgi:hypothetical protein